MNRGLPRVRSRTHTHTHTHPPSRPFRDRGRPRLPSVSSPCFPLSHPPASLRLTPCFPEFPPSRPPALCRHPRPPLCPRASSPAHPFGWARWRFAHVLADVLGTRLCPVVAQSLPSNPLRAAPLPCGSHGFPGRHSAPAEGSLGTGLDTPCGRSGCPCTFVPSAQTGSRPAPGPAASTWSGTGRQLRLPRCGGPAPLKQKLRGGPNTFACHSPCRLCQGAPGLVSPPIGPRAGPPPVSRNEVSTLTRQCPARGEDTVPLSGWHSSVAAAPTGDAGRAASPQGEKNERKRYDER